MSQIQKVLEGLREVNGVSGAAVLTTDGIMVASSLGAEFLDDVVAGLCSFLVSTTSRSLQEAKLTDGFSRFTLNATHGKVLLENLGEAYLVVITTQFAALDALVDDIEQAATKLRRVSKIQV